MPNDLEKRVATLEGVINHLVNSDRYVFQKHLQIMDGRNIQLALGTGTKIGTATTQKMGFFGVAPVVQQAPTATAASLLAALQAYGLSA